MAKMAAALIYLLILSVLSRFLLLLSPSTGYTERINELDVHLDCVFERCNVDICVSVSSQPPSNPSVSPCMFNACIVLLWSRCTHVFRPRPRRSLTSCFVAILLLLCGDVETNPGPAAATADLRIGHINLWSCVNKTELILNAIDEQRLDVLAITESYIKDDHPTAVKNDPAPQVSPSPTRHARDGRAVAWRSYHVRLYVHAHLLSWASTNRLRSALYSSILVLAVSMSSRCTGHQSLQGSSRNLRVFSTKSQHSLGGF